MDRLANFDEEKDCAISISEYDARHSTVNGKLPEKVGRKASGLRVI
ncbi:hypothetical protein D515_03753 [Grimontia indica]|uniref:Uncharacterized protein n=1 Tax=Grimontia indica TaxID=1056512 RepID=R1IJ85_9GAMM|nr:hypothetical protein D515_03753 [Grimontia indica]